MGLGINTRKSMIRSARREAVTGFRLHLTSTTRGTRLASGVRKRYATERADFTSNDARTQDFSREKGARVCQNTAGDPGITQNIAETRRRRDCAFVRAR